MDNQKLIKLIDDRITYLKSSNNVSNNFLDRIDELTRVRDIIAFNPVQDGKIGAQDKSKGFEIISKDSVLGKILYK